MASLEVRTHTSIREIGPVSWARLSAGAPPFSSYAWLEALETAGCVCPEAGWLPLFVTLWQGGAPVAAAPVYVKGNSEGEFVFDHSWARFAAVELGVDYYPKLVAAVPFTPATGPRLLIEPGHEPEPLLAGFATALRALSEKLGASGAHVLFPSPEQAEALGASGFARRFGVQFHRHNHGYARFDDF
jgi:hypothetical protein